MQHKVIDVGYTQYEVGQIMGRIERRASKEGLTLTELGEEYRRYVDNSQHEYVPPFYFWALRDRFDMYLWYPRLANTAVEEKQLMDKHINAYCSLTSEERKRLGEEFIEYRDTCHRLKVFMYPFYVWAFGIYEL